jgi:peptidoglycan lytic transglycosylase G
VGVIMNRLHQNMRLQIDATVLYALGHHKTRITAADLAVNSPYNTYLHGGLPPGPICSPGMASLLAALHPAKVPYLYYVATGKGTHLFGQTYQEHLANIARVRGGGG